MSYLDTVLKAVIIPADPKLDFIEREVPFRKLLTLAGWKFFEIVRTQYGRDHNFVMLVNDDAREAKSPYNPRAQYLSGYPLEAPILGTVLMLTETQGYNGYDMANISDEARRYIQDGAKWEKGAGFDQWCQAFYEPIHFYTKSYPLPREEYKQQPSTTTVDWDSKDRHPKPMPECPGHAGDTDAELLSGAPIGETTFCDGSCLQN